MSEWQTRTLEELAEIYDGPHATPAKIETGPWFLSISSLDNGRLRLEESAHLSEEDYEKWTRRVTPAANDVLFSYETRLGDAALMPAGIRACLGRRMGLMRARPGVADPRFLLYAYLGPEFQATIQQRKIPGATVDRIPLVQMGKWSMRVPGLDDQRAIAAVLGALDDKIAVNERIVATAQELAVLLASDKTWTKRVILGEVCELRKKMVTPDQMESPLVAHYSLPAYDRNRLPEMVAPTTIRSGKFIVEERAVLLSKLNPEIPRIWNVQPASDVPAVASTEFLVLVPQGDLEPAELWAVLAHAEFLAELASKVTGTSKSHQRVQPAEALATEVVDPRQFGGVAEQIRNALLRESLARDESRTLATLRDTLLPKLMSGQITVRQAESVVEDAT